MLLLQARQNCSLSWIGSESNDPDLRKQNSYCSSGLSRESPTEIKTFPHVIFIPNQTSKAHEAKLVAPAVIVQYFL
ncbi:hypothetical protein PGTUg99_003917 [Puccinia graminis f. sp. tritici]|uniref:Uncharacterized protein n=1 Tax=Puccinia graminis f. sp. tritici TaxID=56615 RepID=A0A5B0Q3W9_PUCGR|nr:hypothetical protein PGTUg99_003917 [Puccinia graminis f. sp. tritici]